jgi:hypothetical protein
LGDHEQQNVEEHRAEEDHADEVVLLSHRSSERGANDGSGLTSCETEPSTPRFSG